jgi:hypothetical protein
MFQGENSDELVKNIAELLRAELGTIAHEDVGVAQLMALHWVFKRRAVLRRYGDLSVSNFGYCQAMQIISYLTKPYIGSRKTHDRRVDVIVNEGGIVNKFGGTRCWLFLG